MSLRHLILIVFVVLILDVIVVAITRHSDRT